MDLVDKKTTFRYCYIVHILNIDFYNLLGLQILEARNHQSFWFRRQGHSGPFNKWGKNVYAMVFLKKKTENIYHTLQRIIY